MNIVVTCFWGGKKYKDTTAIQLHWLNKNIDKWPKENFQKDQINFIQFTNNYDTLTWLIVENIYSLLVLVVDKY